MEKWQLNTMIYARLDSGTKKKRLVQKLISKYAVNSNIPTLIS